MLDLKLEKNKHSYMFSIKDKCYKANSIIQEILEEFQKIEFDSVQETVFVAMAFLDVVQLKDKINEIGDYVGPKLDAIAEKIKRETH